MQRREEGAPGLLAIDALTLRFAGNTVLAEVGLRIDEGRIASVIGPNGAGKTSLFNCVTGFYRPQEGRITFRGQALRALKPHRITALGIARTFQNVRLFRQMSVLENVMAGMHCRTRAGALAAVLRTPAQRAEEHTIHRASADCLRFVGLWQQRERLASSLAYGYQRLVEVARALATRPQLLLLDEPAAGLNSGEKQALIELIRRIRDELGITVLLIEHDMGLVMQVSEHITVLDHGRVIAEGDAAAIQRNPRVIEAYLGQGEEAPLPS